MSVVASFTFNPFSENTYIVYDDTKSCVIIDPGCSNPAENEELSNFIKAEGLTPVKLINTHCHIDHVLGNKYIAETYKLGLEIHEGEIPVLDSIPMVSKMYNIPCDPSPKPSHFIKAGDIIEFGNTKLKTLFTPGHSPASLSFYCEAHQFVIAGDALFQGSIGRTDLPGGDYATLIQSIKSELLSLPDEVIVYSGHGPRTSIGAERNTNPFLQ